MSNGEPGKAFLSEEEYALLRRYKCQELTDDQFLAYKHAIERFRLDPFTNQIYFQLRLDRKSGKKTLSIQTGIDGYRLIADRTGNYAGNDDPVFDNEETPRKATVTVYKIVQGIRCAFTASARWDQYYPGDLLGTMWRKMPHLMLGKCGEALALRKAFPAELSGLYTTEEMQQADREDIPPVVQSLAASTNMTTADALPSRTVAKEPDASKQKKVDKAKQRTPEQTKAYVLSRIHDARRVEDPKEGKLLLKKIRDWLTTQHLPREVMDEIEQAITIADDSLTIGAGELTGPDNTDEEVSEIPPEEAERIAMEQWTKPIMALKTLQDVANFRRDRLGTVDSVYRPHVERLLLMHQLTMETSIARCMAIKESHPSLEKQADLRIREIRALEGQ